MLKATSEERGTVAGLAALTHALDSTSVDGVFLLSSQSSRHLIILLLASQTYTLSPRHQTKTMSSETYRLLARTICLRYPLTPVHCRFDRPVVPHSLPLDPMAVYFDYVVINGKRYHASRTTGSNHSSFVHVLIPKAGTTSIHAYGEVLEIFQYTQNFRGVGNPMWFVRMRWFVPWTGEGEEIWRTLFVYSNSTEHH